VSWRRVLGASLLVAIGVISCHMLMEGAPDTYPISVTNDGKLLAYAPPGRQNGINILNREDGSVKQLGPAGFYADVSYLRDGSKLLASFSKSGKAFNIIEIDLRTGAHRTVTDGQGDFRPLADASGNVIFWRSTGKAGDFFGGSNFSDFKLCRIDEKSGMVDALVDTKFFEVGNLVSIDDRTLITSIDEGVMVVDLVTREHTISRLPDNRFSVLCTAPGLHSVYGSGDKGSDFDYALFRYRLSGEYTRVTPSLGYIENAAYAPESKTVFIVSSKGGYKLWQFDVSSRDLRQIDLDRLQER
jgi:hypothetical protein